ncbi:hypothetical protein FRAAL1763 [Frankia alni ACN14a]|uniref:Uncharacterized protein n=1 Tax=Frankia alni (strain DSM 45986 / CECT 9034 / ACN14a) TaxID=326424 RepID=Q0RPW4_FRAAA|nr:hypothetical protein FRAAL1763 [Frankia alni ACN14a]
MQATRRGRGKHHVTPAAQSPEHGYGRGVDSGRCLRQERIAQQRILGLSRQGVRQRPRDNRGPAHPPSRPPGRRRRTR